MKDVFTAAMLIARAARTLAAGVGLAWLAIDGYWYYLEFSSGDPEFDKFMHSAHSITWIGLLSAVVFITGYYFIGAMVRDAWPMLRRLWNAQRNRPVS